MGYTSETIAAVIPRLNVQYFLPAIQREFVWRQDQIICLFDSVMRGYPISSFLFWELAPANRDKWEAYRFIENAKQGGTHNDLANTDAVQQPILVLDGQQRLTSLLISLRGTYTAKKKYKRWDDAAAWVKQRLCLDLLKDPRTSEEGDDAGEAGVHYGFCFQDKVPAPSAQHFWFPVGRVLTFDSEDHFDEFLDAEKEKLPDDVTKKQINIFERNLGKLYRAVWKDDVIAYYTEHEQDYDRVLDIFVRANEGGTKLSKSDLLLSMVTSKWGGVNARQEIYGFVEHLNCDLTRRNDLDKDFLMKACLVLTDLPVQYKVQNVSNQNLAQIQGTWEQIKSAIERGVELVNRFGLDRDNLTSANAVIPVVYYLMRRPGLTLLGTTPFEVKNASATRKWLLAVLLNGVFGGASDTLLRGIRDVLQAQKAEQEDFPVNEINAVIGKSGRTGSFDEDALGNALSLTHGQQVTFLALSLLYDDSGWGTVTYHQDHIFPKSRFRLSSLTEAGLGEQKKWSFYSLHDRLGNLELLLSHENEEKSAKPFEEWIRTRDTSFMKRHLIPDKPELWTFENFDKFIQARETLIKERLRRLFAPVRTPVILETPQ